MIARVFPFPHEVPVECTENAPSSGYVAIVDDDDPLRRALARLIGAYSYQVRAYRSGPEFLDSLRGGTPACLILDQQMLEMTGLEIAQHLNDIGLRIPTIFLTARDEPSVRSSCDMMGGIAFLVKPVTKDLLLESINIAMSRWSTVPQSASQA
jgi:FixJ family two-component response regulator